VPVLAFAFFLLSFPLGICFLHEAAPTPEANINDRLHTELWTSWASLLRSYAAAHGLNSTHHAVVEVSANEITLRVNDRWLRFTPTEVQQSNATPTPFTLNENGTITLNHQPEQEMDIAAEQFAREILHPSS
jgi:hypothetical protein